MANAVAKEKNQFKTVTGKEKAAKDLSVVITKKPRLKQKYWYNRKIKLWQAILMSLAAVWLFWVFWVVDYIEGQIR